MTDYRKIMEDIQKKQEWKDVDWEADYSVADNVRPDMVNNPPHYNASGIECIQAIAAATDDGFEYYLQGNILKYLWRYRYKDKPLEDLEKAKWYLDKLIEETMANDKS
jgi:hypothetical protein